jgi:hypothetical protein
LFDDKDRGGGGALWIVDMIGDAVTNRRIKKHNEQSRGVEVYKDLTTDIVFPADSYRDNIIVSGGGSDDRLRFSAHIIKNCAALNRSTIILHLANRGLENTIKQNNLGTVANKNNKRFDAFTSFKLPEICQAVFETSKTKYEIKPAGRYILEIVYELLANQNKRPYFSNFAQFDYHQIPERINECLTKGFITQDKANKLNSLLMMGQSECVKLDAFFYDMKMQTEHLSNHNKEGGTSILSAIKKGQVLALDLYSSSNTMLIEFVVNSLTLAMNRGYEFSLFLDDVAIANNELLKNILFHKSNHNNIICSKDLFALLGGKEDVFTSLLGEAEKTLVLAHGSHLSCEKWSKYFGEYEKIDVSRNRNAGWSESSKWGYSTNQGQTMNEKREFRIKPEQINSLPAGEVILYDNQNKALMQANVV